MIIRYKNKIIKVFTVISKILFSFKSKKLNKKYITKILAKTFTELVEYGDILSLIFIYKVFKTVKTKTTISVDSAAPFML